MMETDDAEDQDDDMDEDDEGAWEDEIDDNSFALAFGGSAPPPVKALEKKPEHELYNVAKVNEIRSDIMDNLLPLCYRLLDYCPSHVFGLKDLVVRLDLVNVKKYLLEGISGLGSPLLEQQVSSRVASRLRLLALLVADPQYQSQIIVKNDPHLQTLMDIIVRPGSSTLPAWADPMDPAGAIGLSLNSGLSALLLIIECYISFIDEPFEAKYLYARESSGFGNFSSGIKRGRDGEEIENSEESINEPEVQEVIVPSVKISIEDRMLLVDRLASWLDAAKFKCDNDLSHAILRLLVRLTRSHEVALHFGTRTEGLKLLFQPNLVAAFGAQPHLTLMILRHVIESESVLTRAMEDDLISYFATMRTKSMDLPTLLRARSHLIIRDPDLSVKVISNLVKFGVGVSAPRNRLLIMKDSEKTEEESLEKELGSGTSTPRQKPLTVASLKEDVELPVQQDIITFLVSQVLELKSPGTPVSTPISDDKVLAEKTKLHVRRCFFLLCLTELMMSYPECRALFLTATQIRQGQTMATPIKIQSVTKANHARNPVLSHLLNDLLPRPLNVDPVVEKSLDHRMKTVESSLAQALLCALCIGSPRYSPDDELKALPDMDRLRRSVLDWILKAIKDTIYSETLNIEAKYSRYHSLGLLVNRMLLLKVSNANMGPISGVNPKNDAYQLYLGGIMLEKGFVSSLTSILSGLDMNYPLTGTLVVGLIAPMSTLTEIAIKMGQTGEKSPTTPMAKMQLLSSRESSVHGEPVEAPLEGAVEATVEGAVEGAVEEQEEDDDYLSLDDDISPETEVNELSEIYRNSALGMLQPNQGFSEFDGDDSSEDDDDDMFDHDSEESGDDDMGEQDSEEDDDMEIVIPQPFHGAEDLEQTTETETEDDDPPGEIVEMDMGWEDQTSDEEDEPVGHPRIAGNDTSASEDDQDDPSGEDPEDEEDEEDDDDPENQFAEAEENLREIYDNMDDEDSDGSMSDDEDPYANDDEMFQARPNRRAEGLFAAPAPARQNRENFRLDAPAEGASSFGQNGYMDQGLLGSGDDLSVFSRPLNPPVIGSDQVTNHPLLVPRPATTRPAYQTTAGMSIPGDRRPTSAAGAMAMLREMFGRNRLMADSVRIERGPGNRNEIVASIQGNTEEIESMAREFNAALARTPMPRNPMPEARGPRAPVETTIDLEDLALPHDFADVTIIHSFAPQFTSERWRLEAKLLYGPNFNQKSARVQNAILNLLVPPAMEEDKVRKEAAKKKAEEDAVKRAKEAEERRIKEAEEAAVREKERLEKEALEKEQKAKEEAERKALELARAETAPESSAAPVPERITITIFGNEVDITGTLISFLGTGIDVTFLEALPDDMRQDVVSQHLREMRRTTQAAATPSQSDTFSPEFLDALPADIRREVLAQDEADRQARLAAESGGPIEMDPNSFFASLDPRLRQQVLMEQDDDFFTLMPPEILAEANAVRQRLTDRQAQPPTASAPGPSLEDRWGEMANTMGRPVSAKKADPLKELKKSREAVQLLDRPGAVSVLRLIFIPKQTERGPIHVILNNLCENSKSRSEVLSLLLHILAEGIVDLAAIDKNFAKLTLRTRSTKSLPSTPSNNQKNSVPSVSGDLLSSDYIPNLVLLRSMEALSHLVTSNPHVVQYFLKERLQDDILKTPRSTKKKGKERASIGSLGGHAYLPIATLLNLLDRPEYLQDTSIMEQLMSLLATICRRLTSMAKKAAEKKEKTPAEALETDKKYQKASKNLANIASLIPDSQIRLIINVLKDGACSSKTFQYTLYVIQSFTMLPEKDLTITQELMDSVETLRKSLIVDLGELYAMTNAAPPGSDLDPTVLSKFSSPSSLQTRLLRLLKTIDFLHYKAGSIKIPNSFVAPVPTTEVLDPTKPEDKKRIEDKKKADDQILAHEKLACLYSTVAFGEVWTQLGLNLATIEQRSDLTHVSTVLLPLIESFMVVSKPHVLVKKGQNLLFASTMAKSLSRMGSSVDMIQTEDKDAFVTFTEQHRKLLNVMVRNNPSLMNGSFSLMVHNPKVLEFDNKRTYFNQQLHKKKDRQHQGSLPINVRRKYVFEDSYHQLQGKTGDEIKYGKLGVRFHEEEGLDAGGVTREWFSVLARQMFNPDYALFRPSAADKVTYLPNRASGINPEHLSYYKFVGRIIGKAIYDNRLLDAYFTRSFYKCILELPVDYRDIEAVDPEYHKSLQWMLNNDITDILDLTFSVDVDDFGRQKVIDLIPEGKNIAVTEENKVEYVKLISEQRLVLAIKEQLQAFLSGFHDVIPKDLVKIFNEQELELLISGMPDIDIDDWKNNTEYVSYNATSPVIQWFWRAVRNFSQEERAKLIQFVTGTSKVPLEGFARLQGSSGVQKFQIHKDFASSTRLPSAHTCFNQLDLPEYESYEALRSTLLTAISECATGSYIS